MLSGQKLDTQLNDNITAIKSNSDGKSLIKNVENDDASTSNSSAVLTTEPENYPEMCHSKKEKECWKLYQKMLNKGVNVSYDTILRGMLTPTELRAIQKQQKELEEKAALAAAAAAIELDENEMKNVLSENKSNNIKNSGNNDDIK